jgi:manganese-dependent inorganic pyrophosphatase
VVTGSMARGTAPLYVLGHRNPDSDAVCSAVAYAALLRRQGTTEALAGIQGDLRRETRFILERFEIEAPPLINDVRPRVADVMTVPVVSVAPDTSLLEVGRVLQERDLRVVAVTDSGRLVGVCGIADLSSAFVNLDDLSLVPLHLQNLLTTLDGTLHVDAPGRPLGNQVMVGAMDVQSMVRRLEIGVLLVIGDREDAQIAAIEAGVGGLVVTGDDPVTQRVLALARERHVRVITVPHHTFTTLRLIQLSSPVETVMRRDVETCLPDDLVEDALNQLRSGPARSLFVVDDAGMVQGIVSRTTLLRDARRRVVLVDHNERGQSAIGIEEAEVVAVIDHHRIADFWTRNPPYMRVEPVGATSTIVARLWEEAREEIPPPIAGVLLSGIVADTLLFRGPTTTDVDRKVAARLARDAGVDPDELGEAILGIASDVGDRSAYELLMADFKEFTVDGIRFGIGALETTNSAPVLERRDELLETMRSAGNYGLVLFALIDIIHARTVILTTRDAPAVAAALESLGARAAGEHMVEIDAILSRKKMLVPRLDAIAAELQPVA